MSDLRRSRDVERVWFKRRDVAKYFGVSTRTVARWRHKLPPGSILRLNDRCVLYRVDVIEKYLIDSASKDGPSRLWSM